MKTTTSLVPLIVLIARPGQKAWGRTWGGETHLQNYPKQYSFGNLKQVLIARGTKGFFDILPVLALAWHGAVRCKGSKKCESAGLSFWKHLFLESR